MSKLELTTPGQRRQIRAAVRQFFTDGGVRMVYADPDTTNWKIGLYGKHRVNPLLQREVVKAIESLLWVRNWDGQDDPTQDAIDIVLGDMRMQEPSRVDDFWLD